MTKHKPPNRWRTKLSRELQGVLIGSFTFTGAVAFSTLIAIARPGWAIHWLLIAFLATILALPTAYRKIRDSKEPYVIRFAQAFREGFLSWLLMSSIHIEWPKQITIVRQPRKRNIEKHDD